MHASFPGILLECALVIREIRQIGDVAYRSAPDHFGELLSSVAFPGLRVDEGQILAALQNEVLKRELIDSEEAKAATAMLKRALRAIERSKAKVETAAMVSPAGAAADPATSAAE